jgi:hypothetical protein
MFITIVWITVFSHSNDPAKSSPNPEVEACVNKGVAYFKAIGSYPTLKSAPNIGRSSEVVARERCNRTTTAFGAL